MKAAVTVNIYLLICACIGLTYGLIIMFKKKQPMYFKLLSFPLACQVFSRAFYIITLLCYGELPDTFNIGLLGFAAFFLFLYLPNVGVMDHLLDESEKGFKKYRFLSLIIPAIEFAVSVAGLLYDSISISIRISFFVLSVFAGMAGYFNMKHLLFPDVEGGIVRTLRRFNFVCLVLEILTLVEVGLFCFELQNPVVIQVILGIFYVTFLPLLNKETKKWIQ